MMSLSPTSNGSFLVNNGNLSKKLHECLQNYICHYFIADGNLVVKLPLVLL